ncbi:MAG: hypothetical protein ACYS8W_00810 [Planctomycetota bacterium]|jgi:Na+/phosphate symporter
MKKQIQNAIDFYKEHKNELAPVIGAAERFFATLREGDFEKASELVERYESVRALREARDGVEREIRKWNRYADGLSFLGLIVKLIAAGTTT